MFFDPSPGLATLHDLISRSDASAKKRGARTRRHVRRRWFRFKKGNRKLMVFESLSDNLYRKLCFSYFYMFQMCRCVQRFVAAWAFSFFLPKPKSCKTEGVIDSWWQGLAFERGVANQFHFSKRFQILKTPYNLSAKSWSMQNSRSRASASLRS